MKLTRRTALTGAAGALFAPAIARAQFLAPEPGYASQPPQPALQRRTSGLRTHNWQDHFASLKNGAMVCDTESRVLFFWPEEGGEPYIFPTSVPLTDQLTRRGRTSVTLKRPAPDWRPTPNMLKRDPSLPTYVGPGPENPLGTRALNLSWTYYRIHGTNDVRKIGRRSSNGCIGLYNNHIEWLYEQAVVGTQVVLL